MKADPQPLILVSLLATALCAITGCDRNTSDNAPPGTPEKRTAGQAVDDTALAANVKAALAADTMKYPDVNVNAYKGTVQLSGFADTKDQKNRATDVARKVANVQNIENNITVKETVKENK